MKHAVVLAAFCLLAVTRPVAAGERFELHVGAQTPVSRAVLAETRSIIAARLRAAGIGGTVTLDLPSSLRVSLDDALPKRLVSLLTTPGKLVFRIVPNGPTYRAPGGRRTLRSASAGIDRIFHSPLILFTTTDAVSFGRFTAAHLGQNFGIYVDGRLLTSPTLGGAVRDSGEITGHFTVDETRFYAAVMGFEQLPAPVRVVGLTPGGSSRGGEDRGTMLRNESLRWAGVLSSLKTCSGEHVRIRDGGEFAPAGEITTRPTAKGSAFGLIEAETATTRVSLVERLEALAKNSAARFRASASARADGAHLPIEAVRDETDEAGTVWATIETRRPKLAYNASQSTVRFPGGRSKQVKR